MAKNKGISNSQSNRPVQVTEAWLPPREEFLAYVNQIYDSHMLSNQGPLVATLEGDLASFLGVPQVSLCANGTLALQLALALFGLQGKKVITTPFTYVATLSSLLWENCQPLFADIDPDNLCLAPAAAERILAENPDAAAILPVHVFGFACDVAAFAKIGQSNGLKIIYDGAHAFGSMLDGKSLLAYGDASICSFHATKLFHTVEGGCLIARNPGAASEIALLRAFGHCGDTHVRPGINAKLSELHAAMGLCGLVHMPELLAARAKAAQAYDSLLEPAIGSLLRKPAPGPGLEWNHAYYPLIFPSEKLLLKAIAALKEKNIHPRRYFFPSLTQLPYIQGQSCPIAEDIASRILCLPFWANMPNETIERVCETLLATLA